MPAPSPERAAAQAKGLKTYFTGRPCKAGHVAERYVATKTCVVCSSQYRAQNLDRVKVIEARWRERNREIANKRSADWRKKYPDRQKKAEINYRSNNPEKRKLTNAKYREANAEHGRAYAAKWRENNKPYLAAKSARRRFDKRNAIPPWADLMAIKAIYDEAAHRRSETGVEWDVDHKHPLKHDLICGLHCEANLQIILASENRSKGNRLPADVFAPVTLT